MADFDFKTTLLLKWRPIFDELSPDGILGQKPCFLGPRELVAQKVNIRYYLACLLTKYSKASSYIALSYKGLADAGFLIGPKIIWDDTDLCSENLKLHGVLMILPLPYYVTQVARILATQIFSGPNMHLKVNVCILPA